ncbi:hypothetical protein EYF80_017005 [Liparis tanakae]|uniref:Uncharacterized protein n=1 Tax=Liparis tanakae TaxID=230148 RepID=A0A4Z2I4M4_9TELE|nr:hypothetical protein EYF80_017005 [Liparis tanakae]
MVANNKIKFENALNLERLLLLLRLDTDWSLEDEGSKPSDPDRFSVLFLSAVLPLRPVIALAGDKQSAGEQNTKDQSVGVAF